MSRTIHINLLKKSERRSSLPVRFRVMVPLLSCLTVLIILIGTGLLSFKRKALQERVVEIASKREDLKSSDAEHSALKERAHAALVELGQLESYFGGRHIYAPTLLALPHVVPPTMQLASLQVTAPVRVFEAVPTKRGAKSSAKAPAKDSKMTDRESVNLRLAGLVTSASSIDELKIDLLSGTFTNWIVDVEIPRGSFKASGSTSGLYVFELNATFVERVFK